MILCTYGYRNIKEKETRGKAVDLIENEDIGDAWESFESVGGKRFVDVGLNWNTERFGSGTGQVKIKTEQSFF